MVRGSAAAQLAVSAIESAGTAYVLVSWSMSKPSNWHLLTRAELEVASALLDGGTNQQIAAARGSSVRTVANQVASIFRKLGVGSRGELAANGARAV
jgi:DNA-binding CsgD family transcriptional regulator